MLDLKAVQQVYAFIKKNKDSRLQPKHTLFRIEYDLEIMKLYQKILNILDDFLMPASPEEILEVLKEQTIIPQVINEIIVRYCLS